VSALPEWLRQAELAPCPCCGVSVSNRRSYISKGIGAIGAFFALDAHLERAQAGSGFLQRSDARVKVVALATALTAAAFTRHLAPLVVIYVVTLAAVRLSRLPVLGFALRPLVGVTAFSLFGILPAALNLVVDGPVAFTILKISGPMHLGPLTIPADVALTTTGIAVVSVLFMRALTMATAVWAVVATTSFDKLTSALLWLRVPELPVLLLRISRMLLGRLARRAHDLHLAKRSRTIKLASAARERRWVGSSIGYLLGYSLRAGDELSQAMAARGFRGKVRRLPLTGLSRAQYVVMLAFPLALAGIASGGLL